MKINAVSVTSRDLKQTAKFYSLLGFKFPEFDDTEQHIESDAIAGSARLMVDSVTMSKDITGLDPKPANHSCFAIQFDSADEVDAAVADIIAGGFIVSKEPWDAFWGQRYAIVEDPDGYKVDLYSPLS